MHRSCAPQVWLYTLLGADYEGTAELLPHWLAHYLRTLAFPRERLLVVVNHNSSRAEARAELEAVQRVLTEWGVEHTLWTGRYSSDAHLKASGGWRASVLGWTSLGSAEWQEGMLLASMGACWTLEASLPSPSSVPLPACPGLVAAGRRSSCNCWTSE